jgi:CysZ protein
MQQETNLPHVAASPVGFIGGFLILFKGLRLVYIDHRELAKWYLPPMILCLVFVVASWFLFWGVAEDIVQWVWSEPDTEAWWGIQHVLWRATSVILWATLAVITAISTVFLFSLFAAPFSDFLSESIEGIQGTWTPRPFSIGFLLKDLAATVYLELMRFGIKLMWLLPLFVLSFVVPVVGNFVYIFFGGYFLCKYTGMDFIDWCAARRGWPWKERLAFARKHRFALVGLGSAVVLSLMVPLLFVVVWPGAVAGGTLLFLNLTGTPRALEGKSYPPPRLPQPER